MLHPKAMAQAKPGQSQSMALAVGFAWRFSEPRPPQAKPEHHYILCSENYFWDLVHTYATEPYEPGFIHSKKILEADMGTFTI